MKEILLKDITKSYNNGSIETKVLKGINLKIDSGEFIVILGPSGSGKSTIINLIGGLDKPSSGHIYYDGKDLASMTNKEMVYFRRNTVGYIFQFFTLISNLTVYENIKLVADISTDALDIFYILKQLDLFDLKDRFPYQLSGGQQQRVAIARAIVKNSDIILCDEPTGSLDTNSAVCAIKLLKYCNVNLHKTILFITHSLGIAKTADKVIKLKDGNIQSIVKQENPIAPDLIEW